MASQKPTGVHSKGESCLSELFHAFKTLASDIIAFCEHASGTRLRSYQVAVAKAIFESVKNKLGLTFVVMFPRQSGKNELQAQIETYLLTIFSQTQAEMVKVSPTWKPQSLNAMRRLERVLKRNTLATDLWKKESGYIYRVGTARIFFFSGSPTANIVGATANVLLECDEAQDVGIAKWDKDVAPMAASTNATRVFWGTAWTSKTLLARELRAARLAQDNDGRRRVFTLNAEEVGAEVPAYKQFVAEQIARLGRNHPLVRTQYFSEEIDSEGGMFPLQRQAMMKGKHGPLTAPPSPTKAAEGPMVRAVYVMALDVAGEDESVIGPNGGLYRHGQEELKNKQRDSTALTIAEIDLSTLADDLIHAPTYLVRHRQLWTGVKHSLLYPQLRGLIETWQPRYLVVDATGVGAGLASFLQKAYPDKVIPFIFTTKSKSDLGWSFLAVIESGRYKEPDTHPTPILPIGRAPLEKGRDGVGVYGEFWQQVEACQSEILEGPGKLMRWGVPDGTRHPATGQLIHDDLVISAALLSTLDSQPWGLGISQIVKSEDLFEHMKEVF